MYFLKKSNTTLAKYLTVFSLCILYLIVSHLLGKHFFSAAEAKAAVTGTGDGFFWQITAPGNGITASLHKIRYFIASPFVLMDAWLHPFILFCYAAPLFFTKKTEHVFIALSLLFFSLLFSYRTALVMLPIALLVDYVVHDRKNSWVLPCSLLLSLLSTGSFFAWLILLLINMKKINLAQRTKIHYLLLPLAIIAISGSILHKILFFLDGTDSTNVTIEAYSRIDAAATFKILLNMLERGIFWEAYIESSPRFYVITAFFLLTAFMACIRRDGISLVIGLLFLIGMLVEGLGLFSLFIAIPLLIVFSPWTKALAGRYCHSLRQEAHEKTP